MINRLLYQRIKERIDYRKAIVLLGPRQVGKTTLIKKLASDLGDFIWLDGDDPDIRQSWENPSKSFIEHYIGNKKVVIIDEAQRIMNIGIHCKMIIDMEKNIQLIISGSSSLDLTQGINEPLTGRKWAFNMYPFSWYELKQHYSFGNTLHKLEQFLIYGMYPDIINHPNDSIDLLKNLTESYLFKDLLSLIDLRKPELLFKILQALAWQIGNEVSYNELAQLVGADKQTVSNYIHFLEKVYVIFRLDPFSKNPRNEINTTRKIYFYDNGIRNSLINSFSPLSGRNDIGALWENFLISERLKFNAYNKNYRNTYFWRNKYQAEIDYIEIFNEQIEAFEIKWNPKSTVKFPKNFLETYHPDKTEIIHRDNYWEWLDIQ